MDQIAQAKSHVASTADVCGGKPCVAGTRVRVWDIAVHSQAGESPDEILTHFPHLTLADVHSALAYYFDNRGAIEAQIAEDDRFADALQRDAASMQ